MNFKCKCGSTKYRQISFAIKQCQECGSQIASEGEVDEELDFSEERNEEEINPNEIKVGEGLWAQLEAMQYKINSYYISPEMVYSIIMES